jgi:hypothetical protein
MRASFSGRVPGWVSLLHNAANFVDFAEGERALMGERDLALHIQRAAAPYRPLIFLSPLIAPSAGESPCRKVR